MPSTEIVAAARGWVGTPYRHQHRRKGRGCDCVGLIIGVGQETGLLDWDEDAWARWSAYGRNPNPAHMSQAIEYFLRPVMIDPRELAPVGCIAFMGWRPNLPMHLGIRAEFDGRPTLIHAYSHVGKVVEHGFAGEWPSRVVSWWRYPGAPEEI